MRDSMTSSDDKEHRSLVREAADLWLRLQAAPKDGVLRDEARQWRSLSAAHDRAFAAAERIWAMAGERESLAVASASPRRRWSRWRSHPKKLTAALASAAAIAGLALFSAPTLTLMWQSDYRTGTGEMRRLTLADGSSVTLDTATAIAVDDKDGHRGVRLLAGRAWFDVAKNPVRPFTVSAAEARVTVTGTAFDVGFDEDSIDVALARGGVRVAWNGAPALTMAPGERVRIARPSLKVERSKAALTAIGSWRRGRLLLENVSLAEGVAQLRRYHSGGIILTGAALRERRVTGVFDVHKPDEALRLMVRQHGATVREITPWLLIVSES
jgi:transmembrane sensor